MAEGTNTTIRDLIRIAADRGMTRTRIADAAGCSRVHLWRLENDEPTKETALTRRIREMLGEPDPLRHSLDVAVRRIAGSGANRPEQVLQLLLAIEGLLAGSEETRPPGDER